MLQTLEDINNNISTHDKVAIYGAGQYATMFYAYLQSAGLQDVVKCFVVTKRSAGILEKEGKPIKGFSELVEELSEYYIVIAIAEASGVFVQNMLNEHDICSYTQLNISILEEMRYQIFQNISCLPLQRNQIFIECHKGKGYQCNCKYIAEELFRIKAPVEIVWSVSEGYGDDLPGEIRKVQRYSYQYYEAMYSSGIAVWNAADNEYKRSNQYFINTWHGSGPFKKVQASIQEGKNQIIKQIEKRNNLIDVFISNTGDNTEMFRESFLYHGEIYECGSPRNDIFFRNNKKLKENVCRKLDIDSSKKIVLYAPTYRGDLEKSFAYYDIDMKRVLESLEERFGSEFVLLYRFHYFLNDLEEARKFYSGAMNVTLYPDTQELLVASDILITDYSSIMWDFSLQGRPIFLYHNDASEYENDRGFYSSPREWPYPQAHSNDEMVELIQNFNEEKYLQDLHVFINKYQSFDDGHAAEKVVERIMDVIEHPEKYGKE